MNADDIDKQKIDNELVNEMIQYFKTNYPNLKIDWTDRIKKIISYCRFKPIITSKKQKYPTIKNSGFVVSLYLLVMFGYSKHIKIVVIKDNWNKIRKTVAIDLGFEVNHIDSDRWNCLNGNLEVVPEILNKFDADIKVLMKAGKISISKMDNLLNKYRRLWLKKRISIDEINRELRKELNEIMRGY